MTKDKWEELVAKSNKDHVGRMMWFDDITPENWPECKSSVLKLVAEIDEAAEIYNMENTQK